MFSNSFRKQRDVKGKRLVNIDYQNVNALFARTIISSLIYYIVS